MKILYLYLIAINILALTLMGIDKYRAVRHRWRIPERTLFLTAILGGSLGALLGMGIFWHKVRNKAFVIGIPVVMLLHLLIAYALVSWGHLFLK